MTEKEFTAGWIRKLSEGDLKSFPETFLSSPANTREMKMPGIELILGEELFGNYDLLDTKHNSVMMIDDYYTAKYIIYANRIKPAVIRIPEDNSETVKTVKAYETYLDDIIKQIRKEYSKSFPKASNNLAVINEIFNNLNIKRI